MKTLFFVAVLVGVAQARPHVIGITRQDAVDPASPRAFLAGIYAHYQGKDAKGVTLDDLHQYFTPSLAALISRDRSRALHRKEAPQLDGDPFVDAQEWSIEKVDLSVDSETATDAKVSVRFVNFAEHKAIGIDLVKTPAGWRISEVRYPDRMLSHIVH